MAIKRLVDEAEWAASRELDYSNLVRDKNGIVYIAWGDMEVLLRENFASFFCLQHVENGLVVTTLYDGEGNQSQPYYLAISDFRNNAIANPDSTDVNDTMQRAFVKAVARETGLCHKLYEGSTYTDNSYQAKPSPSKPSGNSGNAIGGGASQPAKGLGKGGGGKKYF